MRRRWMARVAALVATGFLFSSTGAAYYYYTYFNTSSSPYTPILARFDLNTLTNNTVPFFVSGAGPSSMYSGDSFQAIISQISAAANVWNGVSTSSIRLAFGGLYSPGATESAPGIQIQFSDDVPPGLLAFTTLESFGNLTSGQNGTFIPVYLSVTSLPSDLGSSTYFNGPSYSEQFFVTLVHEFGHTMGLQHTLASSVMSTYSTTAATKASPLGLDDIAGISLLYPAGNYLSTVGGISGKVTLNGSGVNLASVVAIAANSPAIATLTNPDGTYQLNGIPTGPSGFSVEYYLYVHPLPPPMEGEGSPDNIFFPHNSSGAFLAPETGFATQFYANQSGGAQVFTVAAGSVTPHINFNVAPASSPGVSSVRTYGYIPDTYVSGAPHKYVVGAPLLVSEKTTIAAVGDGLLQPYTASQSSYSLTPGLSVGMIGGAAQIGNLRPFTPPNPFIALDVSVSNLAGPGPKHLLFNTPGNLYVLPSGFTVVQAPPPVISSLGPAVDGNGNPAVAITGQQFTPTTQVLFDGLPAVVESQTSNSLMVTPPLAPAGYTAAVAVFNVDGQSSLFLNPTAPTYTYAASSVTANPSLVVSPSVIPAGGNVTVVVRGINTNFTQGVTMVGFGTSDVQVNQVNVLSATRLTAVVSTAVTIATAGITVTTGLEVVSQVFGSQIAPADTQ
jgi:Matrixin/IPT/TIG domain